MKRTKSHSRSPILSAQRTAPILTAKFRPALRTWWFAPWNCCDSAAGCNLGARVQLTKRIPVAAGMGGGSSDAAAALQLGNLGWRLGLSQNKLTTIAAELGSDVPFFLSSGAAICRGRGEQVERTLSILPLNVVIVKPSQGLATADVYRAWDDQPHPGRHSKTSSGRRRLNELIESLRRGDLNTVGRAMTNQLQAAAASLSPAIERVQSAFASSISSAISSLAAAPLILVFVAMRSTHDG